MEWNVVLQTTTMKALAPQASWSPGGSTVRQNGNSNIQLQPLGKALLSLLHPHCWLRLSPCKYGDVHFCGGYFSNNRNNNNINNNKHNNISSNGLGL